MNRLPARWKTTKSETGTSWIWVQTSTMDSSRRKSGESTSWIFPQSRRNWRRFAIRWTPHCRYNLNPVRRQRPANEKIIKKANRRHQRWRSSNRIPVRQSILTTRRSILRSSKADHNDRSRAMNSKANSRERYVAQPSFVHSAYSICSRFFRARTTKPTNSSTNCFRSATLARRNNKTTSQTRGFKSQ